MSNVHGSHGQGFSSMPSLENVSCNLITVALLSLSLSSAKYAGRNTWSYNIPKQRRKVHAQGATRNLSVCNGLHSHILTKSPEAVVDHIVIGGGISRDMSFLLVTYAKFLSPGWRCCWAGGRPRAFTALSRQVDSTRRAAYQSWGGDEVNRLSICKPKLSGFDEGVEPTARVTRRSSMLVSDLFLSPSPMPISQHNRSLLPSRFTQNASLFAGTPDAVFVLRRARHPLPAHRQARRGARRTTRISHQVARESPGPTRAPALEPLHRSASAANRDAQRRRRT